MFLLSDWSGRLCTNQSISGRTSSRLYEYETFYDKLSFQIKCLFWEARQCHIHFFRINLDFFFFFFFSNAILFDVFILLLLLLFFVAVFLFLFFCSQYCSFSVALPCIPYTPISIETFLKVLWLRPIESLPAILSTCLHCKNRKSLSKCVSWATSRENVSSDFSTRLDSNQPDQLQNLATILKL